MANRGRGGKDDKNNQDWRQRYFKQCEEYDVLKDRYREHLELLQRLVSRLMLQIDDSDPTFNKEMKALRSRLKGEETSLPHLGASLKRIDHLLLTQQETEERKLAAPTSSAVSKKEPAWQRIKQGMKGLLSAKPENGDYDVLDDDSEELPGNEELKRVLESTPGYGVIASKVSEHLNNLLSRLPFPKSAERDLQALRLRIVNRVNWYELPPTLEDLSNLIVASVGKGQREFDHFLSDLDTQLAEIQTFLQSQTEQGSSIEVVSQELESELRTQREKILIDGASVTESEVLASIVQQLDQVMQSAMHALGQGEALQNEFKPKLEDMRRQVQSMDIEQKELRKTLSEERKKSLTDVLTGLPGREAFDERLEIEYTTWLSDNAARSLVVGAIDEFDGIVEKYGHLSGDRTIQIIAKELQQRVRENDFLARYGGEYFVFILPSTSAKVGAELMEKLRKMSESLPFNFRDQLLTVTMSFGIAEFADSRNFSELLQHAENSLEDARHSGKNSVRTWLSNAKQDY